MKKEDIKNWKLVEVINEIEMVADDSSDYFDFLTHEYKIPTTNHTTFNREYTHIDWKKMPNYYKFFFDGEGEEKINKEAFKESLLSKKENIIILYGSKVPAVLVPTSLFIEDWEGFLASAQWETIILSEDFELIMEVSRDYHVHSNFLIKE